MADNAEASADPQVTFKVKTSGDGIHTVTMAESATVHDLKSKLAGEDYENVPVERQRLIYSGRVMKNDDTLASYKIKAGNTVHMVKSAASNPAPAPSAAAAPTPQAVPTNMAAGTSANNLLAGLTGARFAGHANLPSRDLFGADGGMGAPPSEDQMAEMLSNPAIAQTMNEALNNPQFVDFMIQQNPILRSMPNAREMLQSPYFRQMMTNPEALRTAANLRRMMGGNQGPGAFPAPGATDNTPGGSTAAGEGNEQDRIPTFPPMFPGMFGAPGGAAGGLGSPGSNPFALFNPFGAPGQATGSPSTSPPPTGSAPPATGTGATAQREGGASATGTTGSTSPPPAGNNALANNPFASLFGAPPGQGGGAGANPFGFPQMTPEQMQQAMQMWGMGSPPPQGPPDNRPPEERYADQLRTLNEMGFYDFEANVAALRRSGGSVQGAIEHLLSG